LSYRTPQLRSQVAYSEHRSRVSATMRTEGTEFGNRFGMRSGSAKRSTSVRTVAGASVSFIGQ